MVHKHMLVELYTLSRMSVELENAVTALTAKSDAYDVRRPRLPAYAQVNHPHGAKKTDLNKWRQQGVRLVQQQQHQPHTPILLLVLAAVKAPTLETPSAASIRA